MEFSVLETSRLKLIKIGDEHTQRIYEIFSLEDVTRYYGINPFQSIDQAIKMVQLFEKNFADEKAIRWGIVLKETGEFIGTIGLNNLQLWGKRAEIGYETHPDYWRCGLTSESVLEVLRYSFDVLGMNRLGAVTFPTNTASAQMLQKLGFQQEGLLRSYLFQNGVSHDALLFSYVRSDWMTRGLLSLNRFDNDRINQ